jgi:hypothetical protein
MIDPRPAKPGGGTFDVIYYPSIPGRGEGGQRFVAVYHSTILGQNSKTTEKLFKPLASREWNSESKAQ